MTLGVVKAVLSDMVAVFDKKNVYRLGESDGYSGDASVLVSFVSLWRVYK